MSLHSVVLPKELTQHFILFSDSAWYIVIASASRGPDENVEYGAPTTLYGFFTALTNMIFMFGAHTAVIEKAVKMDNPELYDRAYYAATAYVYAITLPAGITGKPFAL